MGDVLHLDDHILCARPPHRCSNSDMESEHDSDSVIRTGDSGDWAMECGLEVERVALNRPQLFSPSIVRGRIDHRHR